MIKMAAMLAGKRIRIGQVIYALEVGGSEMLAFRLAKGLNATGFGTCSIYGLQPGGSLKPLMASLGITAHGFPRRRGIDLQLITKLASRFKKDSLQIVHTHHLGQLIYGGLAGWLAGATIIHTEHEHYSFAKRRHRSLLRILSAITAYVTAVSPSVEQFLRSAVGIPARKVRTVINGVEVSEFACAQRIARNLFGWTDDDVVIGCVARLEPEKNHRGLIEAMSHLFRRNPFVRLLLVGDGSEHATIQQMIDERGLRAVVATPGYRDDIPACLATCDIVALASSQEGLPLTILEAMAAGKPIVATRVGSIPDVVIHHETGLLVEPDDPIAMSRALEKLVRDRSLRASMGERAAERVCRVYGFGETITRYETIYRDALHPQEC